MIRFNKISGVLTVFFSILMLVSTTTLARSCIDVQDKQAFEIQALKNEMMLVAVTCDRSDRYNQTMIRFKDEFVKQDKIVNQWFNKNWGKLSQSKHDQYITALANQTGQSNRHQLEYCGSPQGVALFDSLDSLRGVPELYAYASMMQYQQPTDIKWCEK